VGARGRRRQDMSRLTEQSAAYGWRHVASVRYRTQERADAPVRIDAECGCVRQHTDTDARAI
jgi:hypothetical protein